MSEPVAQPSKSPMQLLQEKQASLRLEMAKAELPNIKVMRDFLESDAVKAFEIDLQGLLNGVSEDTAASGLNALLGGLTHARNQMLHRQSVCEQIIQLSAKVGI